MQKISAGKFHFEPPFTSFDRLVGAQKERLRDREARVLAPPDQPKVRKVLGHEPLNVQVPPQRGLRGRGRGTGSRKACPSVWTSSEDGVARGTPDRSADCNEIEPVR